MRVAILGDISRYVAESSALRDFVRETNPGDSVWFLSTPEELEEKLKNYIGSPATHTSSGDIGR